MEVERQAEARWRGRWDLFCRYRGVILRFNRLKYMAIIVMFSFTRLLIQGSLTECVFLVIVTGNYKDE